MKNKFLIIGAAIFSVVLTACSSTTNNVSQQKEQAVMVDAASEGLTAQQWLLVSLQGVATDGQRGKPITLSFVSDSQKVNGFSGCNNYFAQYSASEQNLTFGHLAMTRKFCQGKMQQEAAFSKAMSQVKSYQLQQGKLKLLAENGDVLLEFIPD